MAPPGTKLVATNRQARHDYTILDTVEAGLVLRGSEVKSLREAQVNLKESHARIEGGECWIVGMHIAPYARTGAHDLPEPDRRRKLLLHRDQIDRLRLRLDLERLTLVPLSLYFKDGRAKVELAPRPGPHEGRQAPGHRRARRPAGRPRRRWAGPARASSTTELAQARWPSGPATRSWRRRTRLRQRRSKRASRDSERAALRGRRSP